MQRDPVLNLDIGVGNTIACHINLFLGTLTPMLKRRPDLKPVVERALRCDIYGNMLLTEIDHGLDITAMETEAIKVPDGYLLNTPHPGAAK